MARPASPFGQLIAPAPLRLPLSAGTTIVVNGRKVGSAHDVQIDRTDADPNDLRDAAQVKREIRRAKDRARYQRDRRDPERMAVRQAYADANREKVAAYKREYDRKHRTRHRAQQAAWATRERRANPEAVAARTRRYYAKHREKVLARCRDRRIAKKGAAMSMRPLKPMWTAARQAWLETVARDPTNVRQRGVVGFQCMQLGWTEWQLGTDGSAALHEQLTEAGHAALAQWKAAEPIEGPRP